MSTPFIDSVLTCIVLNANYLRLWSDELTQVQADKVTAAYTTLAEVFEEIHDK